MACRLSQALLHFVTDLATRLTVHKMSDLEMRARYKHVKTISAHTFDNSPTVPTSSVLN